jgi:dehydrogenase/reductase SDR family member 12
MIILNESILVDRPIQEVFKFTTEFSNIEQWDPGVASSLKRSSEAVQVGTQYDLILRYGLFRPKMQYRITRYEPYSKVVLKGSGESYSATDTISFFSTNAGTRIDYQAKIEFSGWASKIEPLLFPFLRRIGKNAIRGLEKILNSSIGLQKKGTIFSSGTNMIDYLADHAILSGMIGFSKF